MGVRMPDYINREGKTTMRQFKRILSFLLIVAMLACVPIATAAEADTSVFGEEITNSITAEEGTGNGLAFLITMNVTGAKVDGKNRFVNTDATATVDGAEYQVVEMGAVLTHRREYVTNVNALTLDNVSEDPEDRSVIAIPCVYMYGVEAETCTFAVRVINLPESQLGRAVVCRPYVVLEKEGVQSTVYGDGDVSTYNQVYYANNGEETPVLTAGVPALDGKLEITAASAEYAAYDPVTCVEAFKVTLTLNNVTANAKTSVGDAIAFACKDAEGNELGTANLQVDELRKGSSTEAVCYVPIGTATIEAAELNLNYVPDIVMPAIGSDIDVTKQKNRIRVSAAEASFNEDGTIHVTWTFKNYTSNWITEETNYITYGYYKDSTKKGTATLYIGVIDTKKHPVRTYEFDVPAYTTEVRITSSKIVYWTEWA